MQEYLHPEKAKMHFLEAGVMITGMRQNLEIRHALLRHCADRFQWATNAPDLHRHLATWDHASTLDAREVALMNGWFQKHVERLMGLHARLEGKAALEARWASYLQLLKRHKDGETLDAADAKKVGC